MYNISFVSEDKMCTSCGSCAIVCPVNCIQMKLDSDKGVFQPRINDTECIECKLCLKVCPPLTWSNIDYGKKEDLFIGHFKSSYVAYSNNNDIRENAASGGVITSIILYLLENNIIDGAILARKSLVNPKIGELYIARTKNEVLNSMASIYAPVETTSALEELYNLNNKMKKYAVVGLPCHIQGISKIMEESSLLKNNILYKLTLLCGQSPSAYAYDYVLKRLNFKDVVKIKNRGGGWPGYMRFYLKNGDFKQVKYSSKYSMGMVLSSPVFTPSACQACVDSVGFLGDITVSDAWLEEYKSDKKGRSLVLTKSNRGDEIIEELKANNVINASIISPVKFKKANENVINKVIQGRLITRWLVEGKRFRIYHKNMLFPDNVSKIQKIAIFLFAIHVKLIHRIGLRKLMPILNNYILLYFKILNLLKKKFIIKF